MSAQSTPPSNAANEGLDEILARHRKEQRDLVNRITSLKKQALKKTRRAVNSKCALLQSDLDAKHACELAELRGELLAPVAEVSPEDLLQYLSVDLGEGGELLNAAKTGDVAAEGVAKRQPVRQREQPEQLEQPEQPELQPEMQSELQPEEQPERQPEQQAQGEPDQQAEGATRQELPRKLPLEAAPKKRNRAKERLARRQAQFDQIQAQARAEAAQSVDHRAQEAQAMAELLRSQGYELHEVQADGHCLFRSLQDQLERRHGVSDVGVTQLRTQAAQHIRENPHSYTPYLIDPETLVSRDIGEYAHELETTAMWGSDMELAALAAVYGCPIKVLVSGSSPITFNPDGAKPTLVVAYYKHSYGLGEHYNSCR